MFHWLLSRLGVAAVILVALTRVAGAHESPLDPCATPVSNEENRTITEAVVGILSGKWNAASLVRSASALQKQQKKLSEEYKRRQPVCARPYIDRQANPSAEERTAQPEKQKAFGETILTAAAVSAVAATASASDEKKTQAQDMLSTAIYIVKQAGGDLNATNSQGYTALAILCSAPERSAYAGTLEQETKQKCPEPQPGKKPVPVFVEEENDAFPVSWGKLVIAGNGLLVTDASRRPRNISKYVTSLITASQGMEFSLEQKSGGARASTKIKGEARYILGDWDHGDGQWFAYAAANVNPKAASGVQEDPHWVSSGFGLTWIHGRNFYSYSRSVSDETTHWALATLKGGWVQNRFFANNLQYRTLGISESAFFPLLPKFDTTGTFPVYGALTVGVQQQLQNGTGTPTPEELERLKAGTVYKHPSLFRYWRFDAYAYVCELWPGICAEFHTDKNALTLHYDQSAYNNDEGRFEEWSLDYKLTKRITFAVARSGGTQDPLQTFGIIPPPYNVWRWNVSLKATSE